MRKAFPLAARQMWPALVALALHGAALATLPALAQSPLRIPTLNVRLVRNIPQAVKSHISANDNVEAAEYPNAKSAPGRRTVAQPRPKLADIAKPTVQATEPTSSVSDLNSAVTRENQPAPAEENQVVDEPTAVLSVAAGKEGTPFLGSAEVVKPSGTGTVTDDEPDQTEPEPEPKIDVSALKQQYIAAANAKVQSAQFFPASEREWDSKGRQVAVTVIFRIARDGSLSSVSADGSDAAFADAAKQAVRNAAPFGAFPAGLDDASLVLRMTLAYRLN